ncbi:MAG: hypothetical protein MUC62_08825, partial [Candidatus Thermoplasmatota archaeon]|nr:hypothetical protein [Candidatus Thermoplasmatota archaeon]
SQFVRGNATDPDLEYGDSLTYKWSTLETGTLGEGEMINLSLPAGTFNIVLNITDWVGESVEIIQEITIQERVIDGSPDNESSSYTIPIIIAVIITIVIMIAMIALIIILKNRKEDEEDTHILDGSIDDKNKAGPEENLYSQLEVTDQIIGQENEIIKGQENPFGDFSLPKE